MQFIRVIADHGLGLCRKPPAIRALPEDPGLPQESVCEGQPGGGGGDLGAVRTGIGSALSGMRVLNRNRQLLWFGLLTGLVLAGNAVAEGALWYINRTLQPDIIGYYVQDFFLGFATLFCLVLLLAGLILSQPSEKQGTVSFFKGLMRAKNYLKPLLLWSILLALAAILLFRIWVEVFTWLKPESFLYLFGPYNFVTSTITQFPFNWTLDWDMVTEIPGYGGRSLLLLIYPFGFMRTANFIVITVLLFVLTPFVVPLVVLEQKPLREAVAGSFILMRKIGAETVTCAAFLVVVVFSVFLTYLLVQAVSGIVNPYETVMFHPTVAWITLAVLYDLALVAFALILATAGGIAALGLYRDAMCDRIPGTPESRS